MKILPDMLNLKELLPLIDDLKSRGKLIVFTNGCFDIMHAGHVRYLAAAKSEGDILVVGLNSDQSVRSIKGDKRPLVCQNQRAEVLAGLKSVDYVTVFNESDPLKIIRTLKPDVLVKGADWQEDEIIGADFVKQNGGKVVRIALVADISTTRIIQKIVDTYTLHDI